MAAVIKIKGVGSQLVATVCSEAALVAYELLAQLVLLLLFQCLMMPPLSNL